MLDQLLTYSDLSKRVGACKHVSVEAYSAGSFQLVATDESKKSLHIQTKALVLSAGAGNEKLINHLFAKTGIQPDPDFTRQQTIKTFMLVLRHPTSLLPPVSGMFYDFGGLFIVSRQDAEGRTVWLIANRSRELVAFPGEMTAFDAASWFRILKIELEKLFPAIISNARDYEWGIYEATKAEPWTGKDGGTFPVSYHVHKHPEAPIWLTWPTLLLKSDRCE